MYRISQGVFSLLAALLVAVCASSANAAPKKLTVKQLGRGSVGDEKLKAEAPKSMVISDKKTLEKVWKAWKVAGKVPVVDFKKEIVLIQTTSGSRLGAIGAALSEKGDLKFSSIATSDFGEGFRYVLGSVPRAGVKTVDGKKLGK
jgi:hypothetical protein